MTEEERLRRGKDVFKKVHGDALDPYPAGAGLYHEMALRNIYNDVWGRDGMSVRERRLAVMGALAARDQLGALEKHLRSVLSLNELTWDEIYEVAVALSPYIGAPSIGGVFALIKTLRNEASANS
jgi:4-carboxymuconolactone decarboxylase